MEAHDVRHLTWAEGWSADRLTEYTSPDYWRENWHPEAGGDSRLGKWEGSRPAWGFKRPSAYTPRLTLGRTVHRATPDRYCWSCTETAVHISAAPQHQFAKHTQSGAGHSWIVVAEHAWLGRGGTMDKLFAPEYTIVGRFYQRVLTTSPNLTFTVVRQILGFDS